MSVQFEIDNGKFSHHLIFCVVPGIIGAGWAWWFVSKFNGNFTAFATFLESNTIVFVIVNVIGCLCLGKFIGHPTIIILDSNITDNIPAIYCHNERKKRLKEKLLIVKHPLKGMVWALSLIGVILFYIMFLVSKRFQNELHNISINMIFIDELNLVLLSGGLLLLLLWMIALFLVSGKQNVTLSDFAILELNLKYNGKKLNSYNSQKLLSLEIIPDDWVTKKEFEILSQEYNKMGVIAKCGVFKKDNDMKQCIEDEGSEKVWSDLKVEIKDITEGKGWKKFMKELGL